MLLAKVSLFSGLTVHWIESKALNSRDIVENCASHFEPGARAR
jgi:hypothetical protein